MCSLSSTADADESLTDAESYFLQLINLTRSNPLAVAKQLGLEKDITSSSLSNLENLMSNGLPPLSSSAQLSLSATHHTLDMVEHNYYSRQSKDGKTPKERIAQTGYSPKIVGETLGMVSFINYLSPKAAARAIFLSMFRDELRPERDALNILSNSYQEIGISLKAADFEIHGRTYNVYIATCDFAQSAANESELSALELINQIRHEPLAYAKSIGLDVDGFPGGIPDLLESSEIALPPLCMNSSLQLATEQHGHDMLASGQLRLVTEESIKTPISRAKENGFVASRLRATFRLISSTEHLGSQIMARKNIERIFIRELTMPAANRVMLNPHAEYIGISLLEGIPNGETKVAENLSPYYNQLIALYTAREKDLTGSYHLKGTAYQDLNLNGLYDMGEGINNFLLKVQKIATPNGTEIEAATNTAGGFAIPLNTGQFRIMAERGNETIEIDIDMKQKNSGVILEFDNLTDNDQSG